MQERIHILEKKMTMIEYKVELHHDHIEDLIATIKLLTNKIDKKIERDTKMEYIGRGIVAMLVADQLGVFTVLGAIIGVK